MYLLAKFEKIVAFLHSEILHDKYSRVAARYIVVGIVFEVECCRVSAVAIVGDGYRAAADRGLGFRCTTLRKFDIPRVGLVVILVDYTL